MHRENFIDKSLAALGFLLGVITFLSSLIMTMTWLHFSIPFGLNVSVFSFLLMLSFMILAATSIVALVVLKNEVNWHERIPDSLQDIFHDSHWTLNRLIH
jgi:tellurite resistance protein TehA-like permease